MKTLTLVLFLNSLVISAFANDFIRFAQLQQQAIRSENWHSAISNTIGMINQTKDDNMSASAFLQLGSLLWLSGDTPKAISAVKRSLHIMGHSSDIDASMAAAAQKILSRLNRSSSAPSSREKAVLTYYITALSNSAISVQGHIESEARREAENRRHYIMMKYFDSEIASLKREAARIERNAKRRADNEYWRSTGKTFDPSHRPSGGHARAQWDAAKRVYDIFD